MSDPNNNNNNRRSSPRRSGSNSRGRQPNPTGEEDEPMNEFFQDFDRRDKIAAANDTNRRGSGGRRPDSSNRGGQQSSINTTARQSGISQMHPFTQENSPNHRKRSTDGGFIFRVKSPSKDDPKIVQSRGNNGVSPPYRPRPG
jgi:hypothetical protein